MSDSTVQERQDAPAKHSRPLVENMWSPVLLLIRFYQKFISPMLGQNCRFTPSCSQYMVEAITEHGHAKGAYLGTKRICKCHPWNEGGYDPVPKKQQKTV